MKFLVRKAPENFIRTVNDEISSLLNRHFDSYFPEAAYWEDMDKFSMPVEIADKGKDYEVISQALCYNRTRNLGRYRWRD